MTNPDHLDRRRFLTAAALSGTATGGRAAFPVENLTKLVGMLADLAATGKACRDRQVAEELAAIGLRVPTALEPAESTPGGSGAGGEVDR